MIERLLKRAFMALANILSTKYHEEFDMTSAALDIYEQGVTMVASGFVYPTGSHAVGVYIVKYKPSIEENRYGRYN
jgi:hypothetical protein